MNKDGVGVPNIVVPTIRPDKFSCFLSNWKKEFAGCHLIVVVDGGMPAKKFISSFKDHEEYYSRLTRSDYKLPFTYEVHDWASIDKDLKSKSWVISRKSSAIRSYGYLKAWQNKAKFILTLDDDVLAREEGFVQEHYNQLFSDPQYHPDYFSTMKPPYRARGFIPHSMSPRVKVGVSHGGWCLTPDFCAVDQIAGKGLVKVKESDFVEGQIPRGPLFSMCGMNLAFRTELAPLMYFGLQGSAKLPEKQRRELKGLTDWIIKGDELVKLPIDRQDDIWAGWYVKRELDEQDYVVRTGRPYVNHDRASNPWTNLHKERNIEEYNEYFEGVILDQEMLLSDIPNEEAAKYFSLLSDAYEVWDGLFNARLE